MTHIHSVVGSIPIIATNYYQGKLCITQVTDTHVHFCANRIITTEFFKEHYLPYIKVYMTEDEDSLVPIQLYLEHYDIK